jgi:hypothetical protein
MKVLILWSVLLAGPAAAQCTAFLIPPTARVTIDETGNNVWRKDRGDYVVAYPARSFTAHSSSLIEAGMFDMTFTACEPEGFVSSKKTALTKLWVKKGDGFEALWAKKDDLAAVQYVPASGPTGTVSARALLASQNVAAIDHAAMLVRDRLQSANFKAPDIESQHAFSESFDKVWAALVETLSDQKWQIESIDKSSGLITTKPAVDSAGDSMVCATKLDEAHKTWLNVFVKATDTGARVKVNATFRAMREDQAITCYSSGAIEKSLFDGIKRNL